MLTSGETNGTGYTKRPSRIGQALGVVAALLLVAALVTSLAKQLAVLLLRHALTALLDDRTHGKPH